MAREYKSIERKRPTRFKTISGRGAATISRNALATKYKKLRSISATLGVRNGLGIAAQRASVKATIQRSKKKRYGFHAQDKTGRPWSS